MCSLFCQNSTEVLNRVLSQLLLSKSSPPYSAAATMAHTASSPVWIALKGGSSCDSCALLHTLSTTAREILLTHRRGRSSLLRQNSYHWHLRLLALLFWTFSPYSNLGSGTSDTLPPPPGRSIAGPLSLTIRRGSTSSYKPVLSQIPTSQSWAPLQGPFLSKAFLNHLPLSHLCFVIY